MNNHSPATWSTETENKVSVLKKLLAHLSIKIRGQQFEAFNELIKPTTKDSVLDVGVTPDEELVDSNFFESVYKPSTQLTVASVENCQKLVKQYHLKKFVKLDLHKQYPFQKREFDIVVSWATLEHVAVHGKQDQRKFLKELARVGKRVFVTTPNKFFFYELHTSLFFLHWLPDSWFRAFLRVTGQHFWAKESNLRLLSLSEAKELTKGTSLQVKLFRSFGILPTHIIIYRT